METVYADTRIVKRLSASQPGAIKLARRYGDALVCVRYRHDAQSGHRYTTVELVVDEAPIVTRTDLDEWVMVRIDFNDIQRHRQAREHGAKWDSKRCLWAMTRRTAKKLRLAGKIERT